MAAELPKRQSKIFRSERWRSDHSKRFVVPSSDRICQIKESCGSCKYINGAYESSLHDKYQAALKQFRAQGLLDGVAIIDPVASPRMTGYRTHAKLAVRHAAEAALRPLRSERFAIGLFQADSHQVVHLQQCPLHRESINRLLPDLQAELEASELQPYSESRHTGDIRYIAIRASHQTEEVMLTIVTCEDKHKVELKSMVLRLRLKGHIIVAAFQNINPNRTNAIFGSMTKKLVGADGLRESICGLSFEVGPTSFFQVNPWQASFIYRRVQQLAGVRSDGVVAWDLYCGTGQISLLLAQQGYRTLGIEENPQAIEDAEANAVRNRQETAAPASFISARVEDLEGRLPEWSEKPLLVVVNPSRRGLAEGARTLIMHGLSQREGSRLIYVSCEAETLARDLAELSKAGHKLLQLECFDMFPFTEKLEWLAVVQ